MYERVKPLRELRQFSLSRRQSPLHVGRKLSQSVDRCTLRRRERPQPLAQRVRRRCWLLNCLLLLLVLLLEVLKLETRLAASE